MRRRVNARNERYYVDSPLLSDVHSLPPLTNLPSQSCFTFTYIKLINPFGCLQRIHSSHASPPLSCQLPVQPYTSTTAAHREVGTPLTGASATCAPPTAIVGTSITPSHPSGDCNATTPSRVTRQYCQDNREVVFGVSISKCALATGPPPDGIVVKKPCRASSTTTKAKTDRLNDDNVEGRSSHYHRGNCSHEYGMEISDTAEYAATSKASACAIPFFPKSIEEVPATTITLQDRPYSWLEGNGNESLEDLTEAW